MPELPDDSTPTTNYYCSQCGSTNTPEQIAALTAERDELKERSAAQARSLEALRIERDRYRDALEDLTRVAESCAWMCDEDGCGAEQIIETIIEISALTPIEETADCGSNCEVRDDGGVVLHGEGCVKFGHIITPIEEQHHD